MVNAAKLISNLSSLGQIIPRILKSLMSYQEIDFVVGHLVNGGQCDQTEFIFEFLGSNYLQDIEIINVLPQIRFCGWSSGQPWSNGSSDQEIRDHRIRITIQNFNLEPRA